MVRRLFVFLFVGVLFVLSGCSSGENFFSKYSKNDVVTIDSFSEDKYLQLMSVVGVVNSDATVVSPSELSDEQLDEYYVQYPYPQVVGDSVLFLGRGMALDDVEVPSYGQLKLSGVSLYAMVDGKAVPFGAGEIPVDWCADVLGPDGYIYYSSDLPASHYRSDWPVPVASGRCQDEGSVPGSYLNDAGYMVDAVLFLFSSASVVHPTVSEGRVVEGFDPSEYSLNMDLGSTKIFNLSDRSEVVSGGPSVPWCVQSLDVSGGVKHYVYDAEDPSSGFVWLSGSDDYLVDGPCL